MCAFPIIYVNSCRKREIIFKMYVKHVHGATVPADSLRVLRGIISRPVVVGFFFLAFRPLKVNAKLLTGIDENLNCAHRNELIVSLVV